MKNKEQIFDDIYKAFSQGLRRYLARLAPDLDTEDLVQDVFEKISWELDTFRDKSSIKTWIYKIATHTAYDRLRRMAAKKRSLPDIPADPKGPGPGFENLCDQYQEPLDNRVIRKEMSACVLDVVETLGEPYKTVLILKELEHFKSEEIANILQLSLETVKMRLYRARIKLREKLEQRCCFYHDERNVFVCLPKSG